MTGGSSSTHHLGHVARGGAIGLAGSMVNAVAGLALVVLLARGLDSDVAGRFFAASSVVLLLVAVSGLGTGAGLARFMLRYEAEGRHADVLGVLRVAAVPVISVAVVMCAVLLALAGPATDVLGWEGEGALVRALALALPFAVVSEFALASTRALGRMRTTAWVDRLVRAGLQAGLAAAVLALGGGVVAVGIAWTVAWMVSAVLAVWSLGAFLRTRRPEGDPGTGRPDLAPPPEDAGRASVAREFWAYTRWRAASSIAQVAIQRVDIVLVAAVLGPAEAAVYTAATRFVVLGQFVQQALTQVLQPRFTSILVEGDTAVLREVFRTGTAWSVALTWPVYLVIGCAPAVYLSTFGEGYGGSGASAVVLLMTAAMLVGVATGAVDTLLLMAGRSGLSTFNAVAALILDVVACLLLLPVLGIAGAALAWGAAVVLQNGLAVYQVRRDLGVVAGGPTVWVSLVLPTVLVALPVGASQLLVGGLLAWILSASAAGLLYLAALFYFRRQLRMDVLIGALPRGRSAGRGRLTSRALTRRLRKLLPDPVVRLLRRMVMRWGLLTVRARMTPSVLVVGAQRSGSTTLFRLLSEHPEMLRPTSMKGTGYFDDQHHRGPRWYQSHFPLRAVARRRERRLGLPVGAMRTFEVSGFYLVHPLAADRIAAELPGVHVVALLRDPVERAHSAYRHEYVRGFEELSFEEALAQEEARTAGEVERLAADPEARSDVLRHHAYLGRGRYAEQLQRFVDALGADRVHVVDADDFFADPVAQMQALEHDLGLRAWTPPSVERWNRAAGAPLDPTLREQLSTYFAASDDALAQMTGRVPSWRRPAAQHPEPISTDDSTTTQEVAR